MTKLKQLSNQVDKVELKEKLYSNYSIGIVAIIMALAVPIVLPVLGSYIAPISLVAGIVAVMISKVNLWLRIGTILIFLVPLIIFWHEYEILVMQFLPMAAPSH